jgi:hypothetical protein
MGLLDALLSNDSGGGLFGGLPSSWQYKNPQDELDQKAFLASLSQDPSMGNNLVAPQSPFGPVPSFAQQPQSVFAGGAAPINFNPAMLTPQQSPMQAAPPQAPPMAPQPAPPMVPQTAPQAAQNQPTSAVNVGGYQMPQFGSPPPQTAQAQAPSTDISAQSRQPDMAPQGLPPALTGTSILGRIGNPDGLIARLTGNDSRSISQQNLKATFDATREVLRQSGMSDREATSKAMLAVLNPEAGKTILPEALTSKEEFKTIKDGLGMEHPAFINTREQTINGLPIAQYNKQSGGESGIGDMSKSGAAYFATLPKQVQGTVQGMLDGTIQPPSSFAAAKPYWQGMLAAAKNIDPSFDENTWNARRKMITDMAASGNSSMGGILSNGKSAFKHLAEYTGSASDLGNASHDFPGGGIAANAQNYIGNTLGGSSTKAKIKAINDNLGHYGQESTKFYAGTGGGVEERMNALKEMNPTTTSSAEMAAYAEKEKGLMLDRLREKEAQIRDTMGEAYLQKHPVFTPELQNDIARIDANVSKLRGGNTPSGNQTKTGVTWSVVK